MFDITNISDLDSLSSLQVHHPTSSGTKRVARSWSGRHRLTSLEILRSILEPRSSLVEHTAMPVKHQASEMSEESEETM